MNIIRSFTIDDDSASRKKLRLKDAYCEMYAWVYHWKGPSP